jgi:hypothetical protein
MPNRSLGAKCMAAVSALVAFIACGGKEKTSTQQRVPAPAIQSFTASPDAPITLGGSATLLPVFTDGQGVVQPGAISAASGVSIKVSPASNTTYTLQVTNSANVTASATVKVLVDTASTIVGTAGAILKSPTGATVEVPRGALDRDTSISISATNQPPPAGFETVSPVYRFEPSGIVFARPVKVSLPLPTGLSSGAI